MNTKVTLLKFVILVLALSIAADSYAKYEKYTKTLYACHYDYYRTNNFAYSKDKCKSVAINGNGEKKINAQFVMGKIFEEIEKDYQEASKWYEKAARAELANAQYALANLLFHYGFYENESVLAYKWLKKALAQGYPDEKGLKEQLQKTDAVKKWQRKVEADEKKKQVQEEAERKRKAELARKKRESEEKKRIAEEKKRIAAEKKRIAAEKNRIAQHAQEAENKRLSMIDKESNLLLQKRTNCKPKLESVGFIKGWWSSSDTIEALKNKSLTSVYQETIPYLLSEDKKYQAVKKAFTRRLDSDIQKWQDNSKNDWTKVVSILNENCLYKEADKIVLSVGLHQDKEVLHVIGKKEPGGELNNDVLNTLKKTPLGLIEKKYNELEERRRLQAIAEEKERRRLAAEAEKERKRLAAEAERRKNKMFEGNNKFACNKVTGITTELAASIGSWKRISSRSVSFLDRLYTARLGCLIRVDTPRGPTKCTARKIYRLNGKYLATGYCFEGL